MELSKNEKSNLVRESKELYQHAAKEMGKPVPDTQACLYYACALQLLAAKQHGIRLMMQAGSAQWPMTLPEDDDGISATHYGYIWEGLQHPAVQAQIRKKELPELHVWLAHRKPDTIIDPTTSTWKKRAEADGFVWTGPKPPRYLWLSMNEFFDLMQEKYPLGIVYQPDLEATKLSNYYAELEIYPTMINIIRS